MEVPWAARGMLWKRASARQGLQTFRSPPQLVCWPGAATQRVLAPFLQTGVLLSDRRPSLSHKTSMGREDLTKGLGATEALDVGCFFLAIRPTGTRSPRPLQAQQCNTAGPRSSFCAKTRLAGPCGMIFVSTKLNRHCLETKARAGVF